MVESLGGWSDLAAWAYLPPKPPVNSSNGALFASGEEMQLCGLAFFFVLFVVVVVFCLFVCSCLISGIAHAQFAEGSHFDP